MEQFVGKGHVLWTASLYSLQGLCLLIKKNGVTVAGTQSAIEN
jgi:hypothetical protein